MEPLNVLEQQIADLVWASKDDEIQVDDVERKLKLPRPQVVGAFMRLASLGHGRFIPGRGGKRSRLAKGPSRPPLGPQPGPVGLEISDARAPIRQNIEVDTSDMETQSFILMRDKPFRFVAPMNLTKAEAAKVARWLELVAED